MITAKVKCFFKEATGEGDNRTATVKFEPDYAQGRNKEWAMATPYLSLTMQLNANATDLFEQNKCYTLQFVEEAE
jgi:hypothetical protein